MLYTLILAHWLADFVLQPHSIASTKGRSWKAWGLHIAQYTACMAWLPAFGFVSWSFLAGVALTHGATDAVTARVASKCAQRWGMTKPFWVVVGLDQAIHLASLAWLAGVTP